MYTINCILFCILEYLYLQIYTISIYCVLQYTKSVVYCTVLAIILEIWWGGVKWRSDFSWRVEFSPRHPPFPKNSLFPLFLFFLPSVLQYEREACLVTSAEPPFRRPVHTDPSITDGSPSQERKWRALSSQGCSTGSGKPIMSQGNLH